MIFLIEYDRPTRHTLLFKTFGDDQRQAAQDERLRLELELNQRGLLFDREVVLLEARDTQFHIQSSRQTPKIAGAQIQLNLAAATSKLPSASAKALVINVRLRSSTRASKFSKRCSTVFSLP